MKNILNTCLFLFLFYIVLSCLSQKGIIRPHIILKLYDYDSKKPLKDVKLSIKKDKLIEDETRISDSKGIIEIPKADFFYGNYHSLPLSDAKFVLEKENYAIDSLSYIQYFKLSNNSNRNKKYVSDSIFLKKKN